MNKYILIVEDSMTQAAELKDLLQKHGYRATVAANGEEGLAAAREYKPDLIIADILMPVMDGYEMCQALKSEKALEDIPVILLTVLSDTEDVIRALQTGVDYYLTKPYYESHLLSQVESTLAKPVRQRSKGAEEKLEVTFAGKRHVITADRQQILNLLLSTYDNAVQQNRELIETQRELQKLNEQLEEKVRELKEVQDKLIRAERLATIGQLGASVGHELRNPLLVVKNSTYYLNLKLRDVDEKVKKHLKIMEREIATANKIISDLLSFAQGKEPTLQKTQINAVVTNALSRTPIPENVTVITRLDEDLPPLMADPDQIEQVFINMISNAVQAMTSPSLRARGSDRPAQAEKLSGGGRLEIATRAEGGFIVTEFKDNGCGIPQENLRKIFEPLFTTKAQGIGLGLALSKQLVEAHKGTIEVESPSTESTVSEAELLRPGEVREGTTFRVRLPMLISQSPNRMRNKL
jgi:two-component system sensor histidine kinase/response regulator